MLEPRNSPTRDTSQTGSLIATREPLRNRSLGWLLLFLLLNGLVLSPLLSLFNSIFIDHRGLPARSAVWQIVASDLSDLNPVTLVGDFDNDSLGTMLPALTSLRTNPQISPYDVVFFQDKLKFQYPLTSLLPLYVSQRFGVGDDDLSTIFNAGCCIAFVGIMVFSILIAMRLIKSNRPAVSGRGLLALVSIAVVAACFCFYPITHGVYLGQIQTVLTFGFTTAFYFWISGREKASGAVLGVMALVKPQYALFLLWVALRKRFGALASCLAVIVAGVLMSCCVFGFHNNIDYLRVLHFIGIHGESYATNQSINGLLNRLLFNGNNLIWEDKAFAPFNPIVFTGTVLSSIALVGLTLFYPWGRVHKGGAGDFACCLLIATMASPVAWEHHYGILLPIFIWLWFYKLACSASRPRTMLIAFAYILASDNTKLFDGLASIAFLNIFQSYLFFGALLVLILLLRSSTEARPALPATISNGEN
jgi:hypothetical protein